MYYLIGDDGQEYGPADAGKVREWIAQSRANAGSRLRRSDTEGWQPLENFVEFTGALVTAGRQPPGNPGAMPPAPARHTNPLALAGFWCSLAGLPCCLFGVFSLIGVIFSVIGYLQISRNPRERGKNLAIAGMVIGFVMLAFFILIWCLAAMGAAMDQGGGDT